MKVTKWIFVTGAPRSATTFVGRLLAAPLAIDYIHEPFNPDCGIPGIDHPFLYLRPDATPPPVVASAIDRLFRYDFTLRTGYYPTDTRARRMIKRVVGSRGPFHLRLAKLNPFHTGAVIKDPIGCLLTEYLAVRHGVLPVVLIRHPVAFVASVRRLQWKVDLSPMRSQPPLMEDHFADDAGFAAADASSPLDAASHLWRALNKVILAQHERHPEWIVRTHEALSQKPVESFRELYDRLGLRWTGRIAARVERLTARENSAEARRGRTQDFSRDSRQLVRLRLAMLTPEERRRVFEITWDVARRVYPEDSFRLDSDAPVPPAGADRAV